MNKILILMITVLVSTPVCFGREWIRMDEERKPPSLISSIRFDKGLDFCGEPVPLEDQAILERLEKEMLLSVGDRPQVILWIKRANRFFPIIENMLAENNMPPDLKFVAIIESALRPHAGSPKGAVGFWQFIKPTGQRFGLTINGGLDERRNIFKSTKAAIKYLKQLYGEFNSWSLAAAAYNMGEEGLRTEIKLQKTNDYYYLYLPMETQRYVFRALSAKLILSDPEKYGFNLKEEDLYPPLEFDRVAFESDVKVPLSLIAQAADTFFKVIKYLNPEIRGYHLDKGRHTILVPKGAGNSFHQRYPAIFNSWMEEDGREIYIVKKGDNLSMIAERFKVPLPALLIWNNIRYRQHIHPGDQLIIYLK